MEAKSKTNLNERRNKEKCPAMKNDFVIDDIDVHEVVVEAIKATIANDKMYKNDEAKFWTGALVENCLVALTRLQKHYKYIVQTLVVENNGTSLSSASSCFFDEKTDGAITARWSSDDLMVIVSVFCLALPGDD